MLNITNPYAGLLSSEEEKQLSQQAQTAGLLNLASALFAAGGPSPVRQGIGTAFAQGIPAYTQGVQGTYEQGVNAMLLREKIQEMRRKQTEQEQLRTLIPQVFQVSRTPATQEVIASEQGDDVLTREGGVTGVKLDPAKLQALLMVPGGAEAVKGFAETQKLMRQAGLTPGGEAPSPFAPYLMAQSPEVRKLAETYDKGFKSGVITEEDAYKRIEPLARMEESFVSKQGGPRQGLGDEMKIRSAFKDEPVYKAYQEMQAAYGQVTESLKKGTAAGDLAGATKFMKLLDPGSVVRESELYLAMQASGALDRFTNYANMKLSGQKLTSEQRKDFQELADKLYAASVGAYNNKRNEYAELATSYKLDVNRSVGPEAKFSIGERPETPTPAAKGGSISELKKLLFPTRN